MARILILDSAGTLRSQLVEAIERSPNTEAVIVATDDELFSRVKFGIYAAVFADAELLTHGAAPLIAAVRSAISRPMLVLASNERPEDLDPELVTLVVRKPYDVAVLTGILLSAVAEVPLEARRVPDTTAIC